MVHSVEMLHLLCHYIQTDFIVMRQMSQRGTSSISLFKVGVCCLQVSFEQMQIQKQIGEGSFGKVYLAKWKETTVAVKILTNPNGSSDDDFPTRLPNPLLQSLEKVRKRCTCICSTLLQGYRACSLLDGCFCSPTTCMAPASAHLTV